MPRPGAALLIALVVLLAALAIFSSRLSGDGAKAHASLRPPEPSLRPPEPRPRPPEPSLRPPEPRPLAVTGPAQASGLRLFHGASIDDFFLNQSAPGAVTEVPDPAGSGQTVLRMTVNNRDVYPVTPTSNPRAQLVTPPIIRPGASFWWRSKFFLPRGFPDRVPGWLVVLEGPYGEPFDGTPPWHIEVNGNEIKWSRNERYDWDVPWRMPLVKNRWIHVLVHCKFARHGYVEMWVNGRRITFFNGGTYNPSHHRRTRRLRMATRDHSNDRSPNFAVLLSYRAAGMFRNVTLYQGPTALGPTAASVRP